MKRTPILSLLAACLLLLASCKDANKSGLFIPKDAAFVFHINTSSLSSKLSWEEIKNTTWYKDAYLEASKDSFAQKLMDNPDASGIDTKSDFVFFLKKRGRGGFSVFQGSIKDATAFEALVKKTSRQDKTEKDGEWNMVTADNSTVVTWNNSKFAVINDMPMGDFNPMSGGNNEKARFGADSLKLFVKQVMSIKGDQSLFDDKRFASTMKENGDMHFWMNAGSLYSDMAGMMSMMKFSSLFEGNATAGTIHFDDGKITAKMKQYYGEEMKKAMEKWKFKNIDAAVLNRIPSQDIIGVMAMNIDPQGLSAFVKTMGLDGFANMFLSQQDLTMDEILSATKGEFVMALTDLQMKDTTISFSTGDESKPFSYTTRKPDMSFMVATSVNKKASFDKLLNIFKKDSAEVPFSYQLNNEWFVAGNKPAAVNAFVSGKQTNHPFTDKITGHPFGMYIDIQRLLKTDFSNDVTAKSLLAESAAVWKDFIAVGDGFKNGESTSEITINMVDGKTNSLKQLNKYFEKLNAARKANKMAMEKDENLMPLDSSAIDAITPPPPAEEMEKQ